MTQTINENSGAAFARSADGRGALFWAYEFGHEQGIELLEKLGVDPLAKDRSGTTPKQLGISNAALNAQRDIAFAARDEDGYEDEYLPDIELDDVAPFGDDHFAEDDDEYSEENDL